MRQKTIAWTHMVKASNCYLSALQMKLLLDEASEEGVTNLVPFNTGYTNIGGSTGNPDYIVCGFIDSDYVRHEFDIVSALTNAINTGANFTSGTLYKVEDVWNTDACLLARMYPTNSFVIGYSKRHSIVAGTHS